VIYGEGARERIDAVSQETCRTSIPKPSGGAGHPGHENRAPIVTEGPMKRGLFVAAVLLTLGARGPQAAQSNSAADTSQSTQRSSPDDPGHRIHELPDTIIVTANRFGLVRDRAVWPAAAISSQRIDVHSDLATTLDGIAGVDIRQASGEGSVTTLSNWGVFNRHMLLLYDGRVVKDYSLGGFNLGAFSASEFERIELLKGPQSAFYGADAVGGVLNLISRSSLADRLEVSTRMGTHHFAQYRVDGSRAFGQHGVGGSVEYTATDNQRDNSFVNRLLAGARSDYLSSDNHHAASLSLRYFRDSLGVPGPVPASDDIPAFGSEQATSLFDHQLDEDYSVDARYRYVHDRLGEVRTYLFWEKKNLEYMTRYEDFDGGTVTAGSIYNKRSAGIGGHVLRELSSIDLSLGVDILSGSIRATQSDTIASGAESTRKYSFWSGRQQQYDLWGGSALDLSEQSRLEASGRIQFVRNRRMQPSYNLGAVFSPASWVTFKAGYGYAFRLPTIAEQFADGFYTMGNVDLSAETSHSLVGSFDLHIEEIPSRVSLTLFTQTVDSLIQYRYDSRTFRSLPVNVEKFRSTGIDLSARYLFGPRLTFRTGLVYQHARQTLDSGGQYVDAYYVPKVKWRVDIDHQVQPWLKFALGMVHTSERTITLYGGDSKAIDRVYEFEAHTTLTVYRDVSLTISGLDLTDQARPDQFGFTVNDGDYPTPGRRFFVKLTAAMD
jgi:outer membrane cobalamin receptor